VSSLPDPRSGVDEQGEWTPAFPGQRPPFPVKHGVFSKLRIGQRAEELAADYRERLDARLGPATCELDEPMIQLLAVAMAQVEAASTHLLEHGLVTVDGGPSPLLKHIGTMLNTAARIADRLGMDPPARAALKLDIARTGGELEQYLERRQSGTADAGDVS
jgi:hypothetical protein